MNAQPTPRLLEGQNAPVTGANSGIGEGIARELAARGANVAVNYVVHPEIAQAICDDLGKQGVKAIAIQADVSREEQVQAMFAQAVKEFGTLDIVCSNAGIQRDSRLTDMTLEQWNQVIGVNLTGTFLCTRAALPLMRSGGAIVNNLSVAAKGVFAGESAYCAAKHGALGFTDTLREELRGRGIRVIALVPGPTDTEIWDQFWPEAPREKMMRPETVTTAVVQALSLPEEATVDELRLSPTTGKL